MKKKFISSAVCFLLFFAVMAAVKLIDVAAVGPDGTSIGLSSLNSAVHNLFGVNFVLYDITDMLGKLAIASGLIFAFMGLMQLIKRKSLLKVDNEILVLGGLYIFIGIIYVFFEKVIVNYRPIIMPDCNTPEASFPSSHTVLGCVVLGSIMILIDRYVSSKKLQKFLYVLISSAILFTVVGRLVSGVHWFTDIVAGVLLSLALIYLYWGIVDRIGEKK